MSVRPAALLLLVLSGAVVAQPQRALPVERVRSGLSFQSAETQTLQDDDFANPGFLWVDRGRALWAEPDGAADLACAGCHAADDDAIRSAAARYPVYDPESGRLQNLEQRVNTCRVRHQQATPLGWESEPLLALTAYLANLARGLPLAPDIGGPARPFFEAGRDYFFTRVGQLNLACNHCHNSYYGKMLRGDRLSQGHGNGYPAYRFEWQTLGSLQRRLRACNLGVRAGPFVYGAPEYVNLELYLAWRAAGLRVETPAVRR